MMMMMTREGGGEGREDGDDTDDTDDRYDDMLMMIPADDDCGYDLWSVVVYTSSATAARASSSTYGLFMISSNLVVSHLST